MKILVMIACAAICLAGYALWGTPGLIAVSLVGFVLSVGVRVRNDLEPRRGGHDWVQDILDTPGRDKTYD